MAKKKVSGLRLVRNPRRNPDLRNNHRDLRVIQILVDFIADYCIITTQFERKIKMYLVYTKSSGRDSALMARSEAALELCLDILEKRSLNGGRDIIVEETNVVTLNDPMEQ